MEVTSHTYGRAGIGAQLFALEGGAVKTKRKSCPRLWQALGHKQKSRQWICFKLVLVLISNGDKQMAKLANQAGHARNRADKHMQRPLSHHDSIQLVHRSGSQCPIADPQR